MGPDRLGRILHGEGSIKADRDARPEYLAPTYSVSLIGILIVAVVLVALFIGALVFFT